MMNNLEDTNFYTDVFPAEVDEINRRRSALGLSRVGAPGEGPARPGTQLGLVGLCLSGGGIRSACFNLGVIEAAVERGVLRRVDYLSTVSGGGYIGACVSAVLNGAETVPTATAAPDTFPLHPDFSPAAVAHLRDNANYLAPGDWADPLSIVLRLFTGAISQLIALLPYPLLAGWVLAVFMGYCGDPARRSWPVNWLILFRLWATFGIALLLVLLFQSRFDLSAEGRRRLSRASATGVLLLLLISIVLALPALVATTNRAIRTSVPRLLASAAIAMFVLLLLLHLSRRVARSNRPPQWVAGRIGVALIGPALTLAIVLAAAWWSWFGPDVLTAEEARYKPPGVAQVAPPERINRVFRETFLVLPSVLVLWLFSRRLDVNASSMHAVYRDALCHTFLFVLDRNRKPTRIWHEKAMDTLLGRRRAATMADAMPLSRLATAGGAAPYHLICAALNTPGSTNPTLRDRGADFFVFSKCFSGAASTGYCRTESLERAARWLDLGTAMAVSGAAVSSNMGVHAAWQLSFLLSLLDTRLGLWIPNPKLHLGRPAAPPVRRRAPRWKRLANTLYWIGTRLPRSRDARAPLQYLVYEATRRFDENGTLVNISDGGHVDNIGLYELLKRRCAFVIVSDAEADPKASFDALDKVSQYALHELRTRINIDYDDLKPDPKAGLCRRHFARGTIAYPDGSTGVLLYLKSSISGDEVGFVRERRRRDPDFPHTPTSFQFFRGIDFDAYRELGHHIATEAFNQHWPP